jgi:hypothetical protein
MATGIQKTAGRSLTRRQIIVEFGWRSRRMSAEITYLNIETSIFTEKVLNLKSGNTIRGALGTYQDRCCLPSSYCESAA